MPPACRHQRHQERTAVLPIAAAGSFCNKYRPRYPRPGPAPACHPRKPAHSPRTRLLPLGTLLGRHVLRRHPAQPQSRLHGTEPRQLPLPLPPCARRSPHPSCAPADAARRSRQTRLPAAGRTGREVPLCHRFAHAERRALHSLLEEQPAPPCWTKPRSRAPASCSPPP